MLLLHQNAEAYLLPKTSPEQPEQWPVLVLEPMFWLLYAVQSMIGMGKCVTLRLTTAELRRPARHAPSHSKRAAHQSASRHAYTKTLSLLPHHATCVTKPAAALAQPAAVPLPRVRAGPLRPDQQAPDMQCVDTAIAAKAQCVPAESRVDAFMRHIEAGWHKWRNRQSRALTQQQAAAAQAQPGGQQPEAAAPAAEQQQQQEQAQPSKQLLLGCYADTQQWLVVQVLPGLERHTHLAGLLALLRKWTSRKVEGVSDTACLATATCSHTGACTPLKVDWAARAGLPCRQIPGGGPCVCERMCPHHTTCT